MSIPLVKILIDFMEYQDPEINKFQQIYQIYFFLRNKYNYSHARTKINLIEYFNTEDDIEYIELLKDEFQTSNPTYEEPNVLIEPNQLLGNVFMNLLNQLEDYNLQPPPLNEDVKKVLKPSILEELELIKYNKLSDELKEENKICPISSEEYKEDDLIRKLPCNHYFLATNIDKWLMEESYLCPLCRKEVGEYNLKF